MKILTLDIETSPHEAYAFNVWQQNIAPGQIITPTGMMTYAAKWLDERQPVYRTWTDPDFHDTLHDMLNEADLVIGYNHDKFDLRHINREFVERGYLPTKPVPTVDMLKVVKKRFNFPHNRLDYVAQRILGETKLETGGFELWPAFIAGDEKAKRLMKKYNIKDTVLTEKLYVKLRPWIWNHPYMAGSDVVIDDSDLIYSCPTCGGTHIDRSRQRRTRCFAIRVNNCRDCGAWFDGKRKKLS